jgi:glycosyltransferase involved in cell wall biosynthesis
MRELRVIHVVASLAEASGGPPRSVANLCQQLSAAGIFVSILTLDTEPHFGKSIPLDDSVIKVHRVPCRYFRPMRAIMSPAFRLVASRLVAEADVVHSHGLWLGVNRNAAALARKFAKGHVVSPRGNLHPTCLCQSAWKKKIARRLFVDRLLANAQCIHATSEDEVGHVRRLGFKTPIARIPVAVQRPELDFERLKAVFRRQWPGLNGRRVMLFLARVHPHKGILELAQSWSQLHATHPDWHLVIAGPDEGGCLSEVRKRLGSAASPEKTTVTGQVSGDDKWALLAQSELVVLPSHSENFGHVIGEALSMGKPVLTTVAAPWKSVETYRCGWQVETGLQPLRQQIAEILSLPSASLKEFGENGLRLIKDEHDPGAALAKMEEVYRWITVQAGKPIWIE